MKNKFKRKFKLNIVFMFIKYLRIIKPFYIITIICFSNKS